MICLIDVKRKVKYELYQNNCVSSHAMHKSYQCHQLVQREHFGIFVVSVNAR